MKLRTWAPLSSDELKRRRVVLRPILIVQTIGIAFGCIASIIALLMSPTWDGMGMILPPLVVAGVCPLVYRWSERHWYPAVYLYLFSVLILIFFGMYVFGGTQGPMICFFAFVIFAATMLIDSRAGIEWTIFSLITYGILAIGVPAGWITLTSGPFESSWSFISPAFFTVSLVVVSLLFQLFSRSLNRSLEDSRRLTKDLEQATDELIDKNRLTEEANRQLQAVAAAEERRIVEIQAATVKVETAARRARALYQASQKISHLEVDLNVILSETLQTAGVALGFKHWWLATVDDQRHTLSPIVSSAALTSPIDIAQQTDSPIVRSVVRGETVIVNDPDADRAAEEWLQGFGKYVAVPIMSRGQNLGVLVSGYPGDGPDLAENEVEVANSLASLAAIAIENNRLYEQSQQALRQLDAVNRRLTGESWAVISQRRRAGGVLWIGANDEASPASLPEVAEAMRSGQVITRLIEGAEQLGVAVPIRLRGVAIGALWLAVPRSRWGNEMLTALESIADHCAQAAENARLIEQTQHTAQREKQIAQAADKIHRASDLNSILRAAVEEVSRIVGVEDVGIQLGVGAPGGDGQRPTNLISSRAE
jgi:GAF domain-containing protein